MANRSVTLLELHLHDGVRLAAGGRELELFGVDDDAGAEEHVDVGDRTSDDYDDYGDYDDYDDESGGGSTVRTVAKLLIVALMIGAVAVAAKRFRGSDSDDAAEELDDMPA